MAPFVASEPPNPISPNANILCFVQLDLLLQQHSRLHGALRMGSGMRPCFFFPGAHAQMADLLLLLQVDKREDPYAPQQQGNGCCTVM